MTTPSITSPLEALALDVLNDFYESKSYPWMAVIAVVADDEDEEAITSLVFQEIDPGTRLQVLEPDGRVWNRVLNSHSIKRALEHIVKQDMIERSGRRPEFEWPFVRRVYSAFLEQDFAYLEDRDVEHIIQITAFGRIKYFG